MRKPAWGGKQHGEETSLDQKLTAEPESISRKSDTSRKQNARRSLRVADKTASVPTKMAKKSNGNGRTTHNMIERQYRTRLNGHFESLFQSLPANVRVDEGETDEHDAQSSGKKISKGEVLMKAREYILDLEREGESLREDNEKLRAMKVDLEMN
jgi:hypothetical protein